MKKIIITGACGFIGFHLCELFLKKGFFVIGIDNFRNTYDKIYKKTRFNILKKKRNIKILKKDISKMNNLNFKKVDLIIHLAGEAGVRDSIKRPNFYIEENTQNTIKVFEFAKKNKVKNIFYASSSSVYGNCNTYPSSENLVINKPISIYGLSKTACELIAYYYNHIFKINSIGFRFFTVYGPLGRPDMSMNIFIKSILNKKNFYLNNYGKNYRDYTYVDDIVKYIYSCYLKTAKKKNYFEIFNIGGEKNIRLDKLVKLIEKSLQIKAKFKLAPKINLDPVKSLANNKKIKKFTNRNYNTTIREGVKKTIKSYLDLGI
tara:strand:+ start:1296 stop:2249 length:954 start_codon:yes stop_codon:yes gene_type:complete